MYSICGLILLGLLVITGSFGPTIEGFRYGRKGRGSWWTDCMVVVDRLSCGCGYDSGPFYIALIVLE